VPSANIPELSYKIGWGNYKSASNNFIHCQQVFENDYINSTLSWQTFDDVTIGNLIVNSKDYDLYDLGGDLAIMSQSKTFSDNDLCHNSSSQHDALNADPVWLDPCLGAKINLQIIYNNAVLNKYGLSMVLAKANFCVNQLNAIRKNSGNLAHVNLVAVINIDIVQHITSNPRVDIYNDAIALMADVTVQNARNSNLADLTVLLVRKPYKGGGNTTYGAVANDNSFFNSNDAFAIVNWKTATGNKRTFTHEVGHLFDARHEYDPDPTCQPYAHAHCVKDCSSGPSYQTQTIMYRSTTGITIDYYSTPSKIYNGSPVGIAGSADNTLRISERDLPVSLYRADPILPIFVELSIDYFINCALTSNATTKVRCGSWPFTYKYEISNDGGLTWSSFVTTTSASSSNSQSLSLPLPPSSSIYTSCLYRVTVTDAAGNSASDVQLASVWCKGGGGAWYYPIDDPNAPRMHGGNHVKTSSQITASDFVLTPNPSTGAFGLAVPSTFAGQSLSIEICDLSGKLLFKSLKDVDRYNHLGVQDLLLPAGIYNVNIKTNENTYVKKLAIQN
jgi:hypothetical protein